MEKRVSDFDDKSYFNFKRPKREKRSVRNSKRVKARKIIQSDRLDDMKLIFSFCIMILKFFVLLNVLVITSKML